MHKQSKCEESRADPELQENRSCTMSQPRPPPVPLPRRLPHSVKSVDEDMLKCRLPPQSFTNTLEKKLKTPPPVLPRNKAKQEAEEKDTDNIYEEVQMVKQPSVKEAVKARPPKLPAKPPKRQLSDISETLEAMSLSNSYNAMTPWTNVCRDLTFKGASETVIIHVKAELLYKAIKVYNDGMCEHSEKLKNLINELSSIAENLNKVSKGTKIAGITGGASTVAGGVAAAAGVILSPFTAGASLALTAVGVGVAAAGGVTGASAAIANKANLNQDRKKIEKTLKDFEDCYGELLSSLHFINEGIEQLKFHGLSVLNETGKNSRRLAKIVDLATGDASAMSSEKSIKASGVVRGFALGMDFYFTQGKDGQNVKKGLESKLAKKLQKVAEDLDSGLSELMKIKDVFSQLD